MAAVLSDHHVALGRKPAYYDALRGRRARRQVVIADPARFTEPSKSFISRRLVLCASRLIDLDEGVSLPHIVRYAVLLAGSDAI